MSKQKKILALLTVTLLLAVTLFLLASCDALPFGDSTIGLDYFDTLENKTTYNEDGSATVNFTSVCALPLTEYTYSFTVYDKNQEVVHEIESVTVEAEIDANQDFYFSIALTKEVAEKYSYHNLYLSGKSPDNPIKLSTKKFKVTLICNGEVYKTEEVSFGDTIGDIKGKDIENLIFEGWYTNPGLSIHARPNSKIYRDKTLYAKYVMDAEKTTNKLTTELMSGLITIMTKRSVASDPKSYGSGVIYKCEDGNKYYALTNYHVVETGVLYALDCYGNKYDAYCDARVESFDLAVIHFRSNTKLNIFELGTQNPDAYENCISLGYPNMQKNAITYGSIECYNSFPTEKVSFEVIQHDAIVTHGCSGGPLLNSELKIAGINYAKANDGNEFTTGFAIPIEMVLLFLKDNNLLPD